MGSYHFKKLTVVDIKYAMTLTECILLYTFHKYVGVLTYVCVRVIHSICVKIYSVLSMTT